MFLRSIVVCLFVFELTSGFVINAALKMRVTSRYTLSMNGAPSRDEGSSSPSRRSAAADNQEALLPNNGTRLGYSVVKAYNVPASLTINMPLPEVLCAIDAERFPSMSRARKSCRRGEAIVNGKEGRCKTQCSPGDRVELQARVCPGYAPRGKPPFAVNVVYEDDALAIVFKPAGVCTHPPPGGAVGGSMRTAIQYTLKPPPIGTENALYRPHTVHRLDKPTSGLLLCAKTKPVLVALQRLFAARLIQKRYVAIVGGQVHGDEGVIDDPVDGRSALTHWKVTRRARSLRLGGGHITELALFPKTGRTHQLRIHTSQVLGAAILGDKTYGGEDTGSGLFLAAVELSFPHPEWDADAEHLRAVCDIPHKFQTVMTREQERYEKLGEHG